VAAFGSRDSVAQEGARKPQGGVRSLLDGGTDQRGLWGVRRAPGSGQGARRNPAITNGGRVTELSGEG
jgi:hypothetical protein